MGRPDKELTDMKLLIIYSIKVVGIFTIMNLWVSKAQLRNTVQTGGIWNHIQFDYKEQTK